MDIGEQQRVIVVEPEPIEFPDLPDPDETEVPAVRPEEPAPAAP
jgi:hypothetical protein